jgi:DNA polymerase-3 subunit delta
LESIRQINYIELISNFEKKRFSKIYYFYGEEIYLQEYSVNRLISNLNIEPSLVNTVYGNILSLNEFINLVSTIPLFGIKSVIVIKETNKIKSSVKSKIVKFLSQNNIESILTNIIVFMNPEKIRKRDLENDEIINIVLQLGKVIEFKKLNEEEVVKFIQQEFSKYGKKILSVTANYLHSIVGDNLFDIKNEIEKLVLYTGEKNEITITDIDECSSSIKQEDLYTLNNAILSCEKVKAIKIYNKLLENNVDISKIISSLYWCFNKSILVKSYLEQNKDMIDNLTYKLNMPKFYAKQFIEKVQKIEYSSIVRKIELLHKMDLDIKSGKEYDPRILILDLCSE